jgi:L,D-transpeptidase catalytic domain
MKRLLPTAMAATLGLAACARQHASRQATPRQPEDASVAAEAGLAGEPAASTDDGAARALADRTARVEEARHALDAGTWDKGELYAAAGRTSVMNVPAWPETTDGGPEPDPPKVYRLGYLRHGSHAPVFPEPIVNDDCPDGWYELLSGGFVCGKFASLDPRAPAVRFAANPPNLANAMPYRYGYSLGNDTPVYRRVLSFADRLKFEPWLAAPPPTPDAGTVDPKPDDADNPYPVEEETPKPAKTKRGARDAGPSPKAVNLPPTLASLKGRGVLARRMMKGFYVALDRDFSAAKARWWRTAEGFAIPYDRIALQGWSPDFHGSWVLPRESGSEDASVEDGGARDRDGNGTAAFVTSGFAVRYTPVRSDAGTVRHMAYGKAIAKHSLVELSGDPVTIDGVLFQRTTSGFWIRPGDAMIATPEAPPDLGEGEKWIDVDLDKQLLVAFEGKHPVYATRVSSGKHWSWDPEHDHATPTGTYRIYEKHVSTTMDGDVAADGPYSIEDVPWVMYFQGSYALHGAFWHNLFGSTRSHGCVNLSPIDARELFFWTEPVLPKGWHGVFQTVERAGTRVVIHEAKKAK